MTNSSAFILDGSSSFLQVTTCRTTIKAWMLSGPIYSGQSAEIQHDTLVSSPIYSGLKSAEM